MHSIPAPCSLCGEGQARPDLWKSLSQISRLWLTWANPAEHNPAQPQLREGAASSLALPGPVCPCLMATDGRKWGGWVGTTLQDTVASRGEMSLVGIIPQSSTGDVSCPLCPSGAGSCQRLGARLGGSAFLYKSWPPCSHRPHGLNSSCFAAAPQPRPPLMRCQEANKSFLVWSQMAFSLSLMLCCCSQVPGSRAMAGGTDETGQAQTWPSSDEIPLRLIYNPHPSIPKQKPDTHTPKDTPLPQPWRKCMGTSPHTHSSANTLNPGSQPLLSHTWSPSCGLPVPLTFN